MPSIQALAKEIQKYNSFLISGHINPEGDCAGSILATERLLKKIGKKTQIYCEHPLPEIMKDFNPGSWKLVKEFQKAPQAEAAITLDTPNWERLGKAAELLKTIPLINVDHHISNSSFGSLNYIDDSASACGEIVFELFEALGVELDPETAEAIYISISTDTGSFKYSNTTSKTHRIIAKLLETGIDVEKINHRIYGSFEDRRLKLTQFFDKPKIHLA